MKKLLQSLATVAALLIGGAAFAQVPVTLQKQPVNAVSPALPGRLTDPAKVFIVPATGSITADPGGVIAATSIVPGGAVPWATLTGIPGPTASLTGDGTAAITLSASGGVSAALTLATVNANVGTFAGITVNAKGLVTAASLLTITTTAPLTGGGTLGNLTLGIPVATGSVNGYLSAADWTTFNAKQPAGSYITALTGDVTAAGPGSAAATLATVNANTGSFGSSTAIPTFTVNGKGLITAASTAAVIAPAGTLTGTTLAANVVTSSLTTVGAPLTIGTNLFTLGGAHTLSGAFASTFTFTGTTSVTFPTSGTLATTASTVASFSAGTTGFTPNSATTGAVTLAGTLATTNGGTGLTSFTSGGLMQATSSSALTTTLTPAGLTSLGVNSITSAAATTLTLAGNSGMVLTLASATNGIATFTTGTSGYTTIGGISAGVGQAIKVVGADQTQGAEMALVQDVAGAGTRNYGMYLIVDATTSDSRWVVRTNNADTTRIYQLNSANRMGFSPAWSGTPGVVNGVTYGVGYWHFKGLGSSAYAIIDDAQAPGLVFNNSGNAADSRVWAQTIPSGSTSFAWQTWSDAGTPTTILSLTRSAVLSLTGNAGAIYPASASGLALSWNFTNGGGEVDFWNTYTSGAVPSFSWYQKTGASAATSLMTLSSAGNLAVTGTIASGTGTTTTAGLKFVNGSAGFSSGYGSIYPENVTPSATNFAFATGFNTASTVVNAVTNVYQQIGGSVITQATSTGLAVTGLLTATGTVRAGAGSGETLTSGSIDVTKDIGIASTQGIVQGAARIMTFTSGNVGMSGNLTVSGQGTTSVAGIMTIAGGAGNTSFQVSPTASAGTGLVAIAATPTANSTQTSNVRALYAKVTTAAASFTVATAYGAHIDSPTIGAASAITTLYGVKVEDQTGATTNYAIYSGSGKVFHGDTTTSSSTSTGALVIGNGSAGGLGVGGAAFIGGAADVGGNLAVRGNGPSTFTAGSNGTQIGRLSTDTNMSAISFNGALTGTGMLGIYGRGDGGDLNLYYNVASTGTHRMGIAGTAALVLSATTATFNSSVTTGAPSGGTAAAWKLGTVVTGVTSTLVTTNYIQIDVAGTLYKLATVTSVP